MYILANNHHVVLQRLQINQYKVNLTLKNQNNPSLDQFD